MRNKLLPLALIFLVECIHAQNPDARLVDSLLGVSSEFTNKAEYSQALEASTQVENLALQKIGPNSAAYGKACVNHGKVLYYKEAYTEAEPWLLKAKAIQEKEPGKQTAEYAYTLSILGSLYRKTKAFGKAEPLYLEASSIRQQVLDKDHLDYAVSLRNLGDLYHDMKLDDKAEPFYETSKEILLRTVGKEHPAYISLLHRLQQHYFNTGEFDQLEAVYLDLIEHIAKTEGKECHQYVSYLSALAQLYKTTGEYDIAGSMLLEVAATIEKTLGKEHIDYADAIHDLARFYARKGDFAKSEQLYFEARDLYLKKVGKEHEEYARILNNMAVLYELKGNHLKSATLYSAALDIYAKTLGKESTGYANTLSNLADVNISAGDYTQAESLLIESKEIYARLKGRNHPYYADPLNRLGYLYFVKGDLKQAESLYLETKQILEKTSGKDSPDYADILENLAELYLSKHEYAKVEPILLETRDIYVRSRGKEGLEYRGTLNSLVQFYWRTNRTKEAAVLLLESNQCTRKLIERSVNYSSENETIAFLSKFQEHIDAILSFTMVHPNPEICRETYNNAIFLNGLILENNRLMARALVGADSLTRNLYEKWQNCHRRLAKRYARPIEERKKIGEVEAEAEGYEKQLLRSLPAFQQTRNIPQWQDVRDRLKPDEAAVEFIHFRFYHPFLSDSIFYAALLLRPGWDSPKLIPLFEEKQLDSLLHTSGERQADYVSNLYSISNRGIIAVEKPSKTLYELIWKPLKKELNPSSGGGAGVGTIYFAPTGLLHRLNLAAIPTGLDSTLADQYHLIELGSTRQLVAQTSTQFNSNDAILWGGIQFEMDSTAVFAANARLKNSDIASRGPSEVTIADSGSRGGSWNYLKWTEKEINAIAPILSSDGIKPEIRKGFDATEEAFKMIGTNGNSPRILHLATHGFFFPDLKDNHTHNIQETGFKTSDNPLIRSGLLLAGANYAWKSGKPFKKGMENGILTAYEISHMNLSNTELVVLSACETGLGDIRGNEGVYGLQRAFKIAGAKYLIMSLWQVPDFQTQELMTTFYTKWLTEKMNLPEAFRAAQQEMREKYENPYFWAGFVLVE